MADAPSRIAQVVPLLIATSAVFHYLGPAFAVLLFGRIGPLGVAWLRIASAAAVFALWRGLWRGPGRALRGADRRLVLLFGALLAGMNCAFYLAIDRLPLATVGAVEFLGVVVLAAAGVRGPRNAVALALAVGGVAALTDARWSGAPLGFAFAFANCALFMAYIAVGHRIAGNGGGRWDGVDRLGVAMLVGAVVAAPVGVPDAAPALGHPLWLLAGVGVGVCSSVVPYVSDQLAMARLSRSTFALLLCVLPASATAIGLLVLGQRPGPRDLLGIAAVTAAVAVHKVER
jgi:inner membrane transporter RhtA